jgi:hypothetical protein
MEVHLAAVDAVSFFVGEGIFRKYFVHNMFVVLSLERRDLVLVNLMTASTSFKKSQREWSHRTFEWGKAVVVSVRTG